MKRKCTFNNLDVIIHHTSVICKFADVSVKAGNYNLIENIIFRITLHHQTQKRRVKNKPLIKFIFCYQQLHVQTVVKRRNQQLVVIYLFIFAKSERKITQNITIAKNYHINFVNHS